MTITSGFTHERFDALGLQLNARVSAVTPSATFHVNHGPNEYRCASWRLNERTERELFVEQPGSTIAPFMLRVGVYFQDAGMATAPNSRTAAFSALTTHRPALQALGATCTLTPGSGTRDDRVFGWSDHELTDWLTSPSDHRDLVWRWDFRKSEPELQQLEDVLAAVQPVWLSWNAL